MNFRTIGKIGFLLAIIGYFMPMFGFKLIISIAQVNGFEYAEMAFDLDGAVYGILMYVSFAFAIIGLIIGVLLLVKKSIPVIIDWLDILVCSGIIIFLSLDSVKDGATLHGGIYLIVIGMIIALICQIISLIKK